VPNLTLALCVRSVSAQTAGNTYDEVPWQTLSMKQLRLVVHHSAEGIAHVWYCSQKIRSLVRPPTRWGFNAGLSRVAILLAQS
jgi:hypothetical protein